MLQFALAIAVAISAMFQTSAAATTYSVGEGSWTTGVNYTEWATKTGNLSVGDTLGNFLPAFIY